MARKQLGQCAVLDLHGKRCRKRAVRLEHYHGDDELYASYGIDHPKEWVVVPMCALHADKPEKGGA